LRTKPVRNTNIAVDSSRLADCTDFSRQFGNRLLVKMAVIAASAAGTEADFPICRAGASREPEWLHFYRISNC